MAWTSMQSPVGPLSLESRGGKVRRLEFGRGREERKVPISPEQIPEADAAVLEKATSELKLYFQGRLTRFTVPLELEGPAFHRKVWDILSSIPFGQILTYSEIARRVGSPRAARTVGSACASNPVAIIVPCHRVLAGNGLGGFGGGLEAKRWLLRHEKYPLPEKY